MNVFEDLTDQQIKGVIVHHWDTDGMVSAGILLDYFKKNFPQKKLDTFVPTITNYYLTEDQYEYFKQQNYDFVLTCDINFQAETVNKLAETFPGQVYIFDHHHQKPYDNVHYYNETHPACASYISDLLELPNHLQPVIAIVGDKEEAVQEDKEFYPRVQEMMAEYGLTFTQLLSMRRLIDSNYIADDYEGIQETVTLLRDDPVAILTDVRLQDNVQAIEEAVTKLTDTEPNKLSEHVYYFEIESKFNILSHVTRNFSRRYANKIIFTRHLKGDQYTCYARRRELNVDMRDVIAFARDLGLNAGGKEDVVGIIIPKDQIDNFFPKIEEKLKSIQI